MKSIDLSDRSYFRRSYLDPALIENYIEMTQPDSPNSPTQKYRLTEKGRSILQAE
jgi:predicted transcriptional regulator